MSKPKIRFKGYEEDWEQRKLGDVLEEFSNKSTVEDEYTVLSSTNTGMEFRDGRVSGTSNLGYKIIEIDDLVLSPQNLWLGNININNLEKGLVSPSYKTFKLRNIDKEFFRPQLRTKKMLELYKQASVQGASVVRRNLDMDLFEQIELNIPMIEEQAKIGEYFFNLDYLITLHQRKCEETKKLKKYMLQKMFPQNGKRVPEIRFVGFTDDWEQRKFKNIASRESTTQTSSSEFPSVEYEDVLSEEGRLNKNIYLKKSEKMGIVFDGSQVLYGKLRPYLHNWLNPDFKGVAVGDWWVLKPIDTNKDFLYRLIQTQQFDNIANLSSGSKMPRADWNLVVGTEFMIPGSNKEQQKIGVYFSSLDHLITLHQRKYEELQKIKKFMLQNMFI